MKTIRGFTLIELMIVVAIIAILAAVGYPSYLGSISKARRSDAQQLMLDVVNREEQVMLDIRDYSTDFTVLGITKEDWTCTAATCVNNFYTVTITPAGPFDPPGYTITATSPYWGSPRTASGPQLSDGNLTIDNTGAKTPSDKW